MLTYKIINYFGDYGTANFWSNIKEHEIELDFAFIESKGFNAVMLMVPYSSFCQNIDSTFICKYTGTLTFLMNCAERHGLKVIARIGYLWESNFDHDRTLERFIDMYAKFSDGNVSIYENQFIEFVQFYSRNYGFEHVVLSWEDFFWPINFHNLTRGNDNQHNEREMIRFMEHLLGRIGRIDHLHVEQRTNGDFDPIKYNPSVSYAYYNTYNIQSWDDDYIDRNFGRGILISGSMLLEKQFVEWLSRMKQGLALSKDRKLIIDQFNIIDNTFSDDEDHQEFNLTKKKLLCDSSNFAEVMDFITPIIKNNIYGIGFWSLWSTYAGHVYNGTFKFGMEGWDSDGMLSDAGVTLSKKQHISTNLGYVRLDGVKNWNIIIKYSCISNSQIMLRFNNKVEILDLSRGENMSLIKKYRPITDRTLSIEVLSEQVTIHRIDCFNIMHKSFLFDMKRNPVCNEVILKNLLD